MNDKNFGYLGPEFQKSLIKALIEDKKFSVSIINLIEPNYFDGNYFRFVVQNIKELYEKFEVVPTYENIKANILNESASNDTALKVHLDTLEQIRNWTLDGIKPVEESARKFCKQQVLKSAIKRVEKIIEKGSFERYNDAERIIQEALQVGEVDNEVDNVFLNIRSVLDKDYRVPIPTGINGVDRILNGGLAIGEFGLVMAPLGVGKTTMLTIIANAAFNVGKNVLQIFFEDKMDNIKRKHYTIWTGIPKDEQIERKEEVISIVEDVERKSKGILEMVKLPSGSKTVTDIKNILRRLESEGKKIDLLIIDYVDCLTTDRSEQGEEWKGEGMIMRHLDAMTSEFNVAIWAATQGNRDSISSEVVTSDQIAGSIKKAQIAHVVISAGKTLQQKELKIGTISILKSRLGDDGIVFENCVFNNEYLIIDTDSQTTLLGHEEEVARRKAERAANVFRKDKGLNPITKKDPLKEVSQENKQKD